MGDNKRRVLVVGGKDYNIPSWARTAFDIDLYDGERGDGAINPKPAALIVVQVNWTSHNLSGQAHQLGRDWGVPVLKARDGWSSAVAHAARNRVDWFVDAVQMAGQQLATKNPPQAEEAVVAVDNAWKETAEYERDRFDAAKKHMVKLEGKLKNVEDLLARARNGAKERIIEEINRRANEARRTAAGDISFLNIEVAGIREQLEAAMLRVERLGSVINKEVSSGDQSN